MRSIKKCLVEKLNKKNRLVEMDRTGKVYPTINTIFSEKYLKANVNKQLQIKTERERLKRFCEELRKL